MKTGPLGLAIIKESESCHLRAYLCPAGLWTIGWGSIRYEDGRRVEEGDVITQDEADRELAYDVGDSERIISRYVRVPLNQNQFDALVSFVYNIGAPNFVGSSLLRILNAGNYAFAAEQFNRWVYANRQKLNGLVTRRARERDLFLAPTTH